MDSNLKHLDGNSMNAQQDLLAWLQQKLPEAFTEGKIDCKKLKATLGESVDTNGERYGLSWAGKNDCFRHIQEPTTATLKPVRDESVDFDTTKNLFIEGDNLQVLKVLQKSYYGQVKMIYIDPPYNTGSDSFIYPDRFQETQEEYMERVGDKEEGHVTRDGMWQKNSSDNGHYHSNWLSMMYPRLFLARNLLRDDGVIFVSIDDHEVHNLRIIMNEIYGEENFIAELVWEKGRKNDAKFFSVGHEYILVFAKSQAFLRESNTVWREEKPGAKEIWDKYQSLKNEYGTDGEKIEEGLSKWFKELPKNHPSKALSRYRRVDEYGPWRDRDISWPGGGGPTYDVIHPVTKQPCKVPESGWRFSTQDEMLRQVKLGLVVFRDDHTQPPFRKAHLYPIAGELLGSTNEDVEFEEEGTDEQELSMQVMPSCIYKQSQVAVKALRKLMGGKVFNNPKDPEILQRLVKYCTNAKQGSIVLDFFAGSGTTAHAVMQANAEDGGSRRCISVQLPEICDQKSVAYKAGFKTIADISKERIRRAGQKIKDETNADIDYGFKVFKLDESNFKIWRNKLANAEELAEQMHMFIDNLKAKSTQENVMYELILKSGLDLNVSVEAKDADGIKYYVLNGGKLIVCLEDSMTQTLADAVIAAKPQKIICLDGAFKRNDQLKTNTALQMEAAKIDFRVI